MIRIKSDREIELMRQAAVPLKEALKAIEREIKPGVTTNRLNEVASKAIVDGGAIPAFKGVECPYTGGKPFKHSICTSVNDEIIHGIPSNRILKEGDIVSVDMGTLKNGWYSDAGRTFAVGEISKTSKRLIDVAKEAFFEGIKYAVHGNRVGDISNAIQNYVEKQGFSLLKEYQGHGIGEEMHEEPGVPNIREKGERT